MDSSHGLGSRRSWGYFAVCVVIGFVGLVAGGSGACAAESVGVSARITPDDTILEDTPRPVRFDLLLGVSPGAGRSRVSPAEEITVALPDGLVAVPGEALAECSEPALLDNPTYSDPATILASCADSVVGTGTASIFLGGFASAPLTDLNAILFYSGKDGSGQPTIRIYAYSALGHFGFSIVGVWKEHELLLSLPTLPSGSAMQALRLFFPGDGINRPDLGFDYSATQSRDPGFVRASCPTGEWITGAGFEMGSAEAGGGPDEKTVVKAPDDRSSCIEYLGPFREMTVETRGLGAVRSTPTGIDCGARCSAKFAENTDVTLDPFPATGWRFIGWEGPCPDSTRCTVKIDGPVHIGARFLELGPLGRTPHSDRPGLKPPRLKIHARVSGGRTARRRGFVKVRLAVKNVGGGRAHKVRVCGLLPRKSVGKLWIDKPHCVPAGSIAAGSSRQVNFRLGAIRPKSYDRGSGKVRKLGALFRADGSNAATVTARIRIKAG